MTTQVIPPVRSIYALVLYLSIIVAVVVLAETGHLPSDVLSALVGAFVGHASTTQSQRNVTAVLHGSDIAEG